jgi:hypothetical protein
MLTESDPDLALIERMRAPPPLEDARSSLGTGSGGRLRSAAALRAVGPRR